MIETPLGSVVQSTERATEAINANEEDPQGWPVGSPRAFCVLHFAKLLSMRARAFQQRGKSRYESLCLLASAAPSTIDNNYFDSSSQRAQVEKRMFESRFGLRLATRIFPFPLSLCKFSSRSYVLRVRAVIIGIARCVMFVHVAPIARNRCNRSTYSCRTRARLIFDSPADSRYYYRITQRVCAHYEEYRGRFSREAK